MLIGFQSFSLGILDGRASGGWAYIEMDVVRAHLILVKKGFLYGKDGRKKPFLP